MADPTTSNDFSSPTRAMRSRQATVSIVRAAQSDYPLSTPFHPPLAFPELFNQGSGANLDTSNHVYSAVRDSLRLLGLDAERYDTADWNPFGEIIQPGNRVLVKPNWVSHSCEHDPSWRQIVTHGSVIRAVIDYVQIALRGRGTITLADGPMLNSDFAKICQLTGADEVGRHYDQVPEAVPVKLLDLRESYFETRGQVVYRRTALPGDPLGGVVVNLGARSRLYRFDGEGRYYGADYDQREVNLHHRGDLHEYRLSATAMQTDVIIDVPKLKTHQKVGVTMSLKGVVGLNSGRNWLPHRTQGTPRQGGDQFADDGWRRRLESRLIEAFEQYSLRYPRVVPPVYRTAKAIGKHLFGRTGQVVRGGGWHGNDTLWRMVHDINRALTFGDAEGLIHNTPTKRRFVIVDGIIAGQGLGPVSADPVECGIVVAGENPTAVDIIGSEVMGFDHGLIPMLAHAFDDHPLPLIDFTADSITTASNVTEWNGGIAALRRTVPYRFQAPLGWTNYVERPTST